MIRSSVTVSLVQEARGGPFVFWDDWQKAGRFASEVGFDAIEIFPPSSDVIDKALLRSFLEQQRLQLAAVGTGAGWVKHKLTLTSGDAEVRRQAIQFVRSIIDFAGAFKAPAIIGSMQGRFGEGVDHAQAMSYLAEGLRELSEYAKQYSVALLYEPLNRYETNLVNRVGGAVEFLKAKELGNVKILADLFHMNIEEVSISQALIEAGDWIGHLHFVDSNRRAAGMGHIDYAPIASALRQIGYRGYASAEVLPLPDSESAARQTMDSFLKYFSSQA